MKAKIQSMPKLLSTQIDLSPIQKLLSLVIDKWDPTKIWLFGSRARGEAHSYSDWDLLAVLSDKTATKVEKDPLASWKLTKVTKTNADLIVCSESDFQEGSKIPNTLGYEVFLNGITIYER